MTKFTTCPMDIMRTRVLHIIEGIACPHVNIFSPEANNLFIIYKVFKNAIAQFNVEYIITEVKKVFKPQRDR